MSEIVADENLTRRWVVLRFCACLGLLSGMLLSWPLWLSGGRIFPVLPCFGLGPLPAPWDWILFLGTLGLAVAALVRLWDRWVVAPRDEDHRHQAEQVLVRPRLPAHLIKDP